MVCYFSFGLSCWAQEVMQIHFIRVHLVWVEDNLLVAMAEKCKGASTLNPNKFGFFVAI